MPFSLIKIRHFRLKSYELTCIYSVSSLKPLKNPTENCTSTIEPLKICIDDRNHKAVTNIIKNTRFNWQTKTFFAHLRGTKATEIKRPSTSPDGYIRVRTMTTPDIIVFVFKMGKNNG